LADLRGGESGRLHMAQLPCDDCALLNAMGLTDQCEVRVCRSGEPCIVQVHTTRLGLSAALARRIFVTVDGG
jgi:Fe2+ transport system protein FeoA